MAMKKKASHPMKAMNAKKDGEYEQVTVYQTGRSAALKKSADAKGSMYQGLFGGKNKGG